MSACIIAAQLVMLPMALLVAAKADVWGRKPLFLAAFVILPIRGVLYTLADHRSVRCLGDNGDEQRASGSTESASVSAKRTVRSHHHSGVVAASLPSYSLLRDSGPSIQGSDGDGHSEPTVSEDGASDIAGTFRAERR